MRINSGHSELDCNLGGGDKAYYSAAPLTATGDVDLDIFNRGLQNIYDADRAFTKQFFEEEADRTNRAIFESTEGFAKAVADKASSQSRKEFRSSMSEQREEAERTNKVIFEITEGAAEVVAKASTQRMKEFRSMSEQRLATYIHSLQKQYETSVSKKIDLDNFNRGLQHVYDAVQAFTKQFFEEEVERTNRAIVEGVAKVSAQRI